MSRLIYSKQSMIPSVMITDYDWWVENQTNIEEWMEQNLPRGLEHKKGTVLEFDTDYDAARFMLRWS